MRNATRFVALFLTLAILSLAALPAFAQGPAITTTVDRNAVTTDDIVVLTVVLETEDGQVAQPQLPALDGFRVLTTSSGRQLVIANGATTAQTTYQFRLQPLHEGELTIPPFSVTIDGQVVSSDPIVVAVTQGSGQPQQPSAGSPAVGLGNLPPLFDPSVDPQDLLNQLDQWMQSQMPGLAQMPATAAAPPAQAIPAPDQLDGRDYFVEATVDKPNPYQGEQVVYTLRLYRAVNPFGQIQYQAPSFTGFWSKQQEDQTDTSTEAAGRSYLVSELRTVLFPTVSGQVTIDPATFTVPGDFFGPSTDLKGPAVTLDVKPLPADAPASFTGAVGQFTIESKVDKRQAKVGDAITQRITIGGVGNLETMGDPVWPDSPVWRAFDSQSKTSTQFQGGQFGGTRTIERVVVPTQAGTLSLPAVEFSVFDSVTGQYRTMSTQPITIAVAPAAGATGTDTQADATAQASPVASQQGSLHPIKDAPAGWNQAASKSLAQQPGYWLLWSLPIALVLGQSVWQHRQRHLQVHAVALRSQKAARQAHKALANAAKTSGDARGADKVLVEFIGAKLDRPVAGLTQRGLADLLLARGAEPKLVARVQAILTYVEIGRFAPAGTTMAQDDLFTETAQVIDELDRTLR